MFSKIVLALALMAGAANASSPAFVQWMKEHSKTYESAEEHRLRFSVWSNNLELVEAHNDEFARGRQTFDLAMNKFADLTNAEYQTLMTRPKTTRFADNSATFTNASAGLPDTLDWRETPNVVNDVKDQGQCGSCWSFSAVAAMEGSYNAKTGTLNSFSEQELVDCTNGGKYTCNLGGEMSDGIEYIASDMNGYIMTEAAYPYTAKSCSILQNCCTAEAGQGVATGITGFTAVATGDEDALKTAANIAVVSVGIDASATSFQLYNSGVYAPAGCSSTQLDHGVAVVGYNTMTEGGDYWIVRNSWGSSWGQDGYIYMARNDDNKCGIATDAATADI